MRSVEQQLSRIDLNLLISLNVLIKEKNVSRAAEKLYLSQPAMNRCLQKLRLIFDDPLFYRESSGLRPTVKTLELECHLDALLNTIHHFVNEEAFDPSICERTFSISMPSLMSCSLMLPLIKHIHSIAPNIIIEQHPATTEPEKYLENGHFDFCLDIRAAKGSSYSSADCGKTHPVIYARKNHPLTELASICIEDCLKYKFLELMNDNHANLKFDNPAQRYFNEHNIDLDIAFRSGQTGLLIEVLKQTDHLLISNHLLSNTPELSNDLQVLYRFEQPDYALQLYLSDHMRAHTSQAHQWVKTQLLTCFKAAIDTL